MTAVGPNYVGSVGGSVALSGTTWATLASAEGSGASTYATWTTSTANATSTWEGNGFAVTLPSGAVVDSVFCEVQHKESNTTLVSAVTGQLFTTTNLLDANTSEIETSAAGWAALSNVTSVAQDVTHVHSGSNALKAIVTASGVASVWAPNAVAAIAAQSYTAGMWIYTGSTGRTANIALNWYTAGSVFISTSTGATTSLTQNSFTYVEFTTTAPATTAQVAISMLISTPAASEAFWIDSITFGQPTALGSPTAFTRATTNTLSTWTISSGVNGADTQNLRIRVAGTHSATATSGILSIDFARITVTYHISVPVLFGNLFNEANQSMESGVGSWAAGSNTTLASSGTQFFDGALSLRLTSTASGDIATQWNGTKVATTAGNAYELACRVWSPVSTTCNLEIDWYNGATFVNFDDLTVLPGAVTSIVSGWNFVVLRAPAVAASNGAVLILIPHATAAAQAFYVDQAYFGPTRAGGCGCMTLLN